MGNFALRGEYILHSLNRSLEEENNRGYYLQGTFNILEKAFITSRYGSFKADGSQWIGQVSIGTGYAIADGVELRMESLINETSNDNTTIFQLAAGF